MGYRQEVEADKPLVYYRMDSSEMAGKEEPDLGSLKLNAAYHGSVPSVPGALVASGDRDNATSWSQNLANYCSIPANATLNQLANALTMEMWVKPTAEIGTEILVERHAGGAEQNFASRLLIVTAGGKLQYVFQVGQAGLNQTPFVLGGEVVFGEWAHLGGIYDGTAMRIYRNGVLRGTQALSGGLRTEAGETYIARGATQFPVRGATDEIAIYGTALSAARFEAHYEAATTLQNLPSHPGLSSPSAGLIGGGLFPTTTLYPAASLYPEHFGERLSMGDGGHGSPTTRTGVTSPSVKKAAV